MPKQPFAGFCLALFLLSSPLLIGCSTSEPEAIELTEDLETLYNDYDAEFQDQGTNEEYE
ncbi:MAG: hypothetical protein AAGD07_14055 [Planctomycetota bacterium]